MVATCLPDDLMLVVGNTQVKLPHISAATYLPDVGYPQAAQLAKSPVEVLPVGPRRTVAVSSQHLAGGLTNPGLLLRQAEALIA